MVDEARKSLSPAIDLVSQLLRLLLAFRRRLKDVGYASLKLLAGGHDTRQERWLRNSLRLCVLPQESLIFFCPESTAFIVELDSSD